MEVIIVDVIASLIGFVFKVLSWIIITAGCLVYCLWAVLCDRLKRWNQHTNEVEEVVKNEI